MRIISEVLERNTVLTSLNLNGEEVTTTKQTKKNKGTQTGNNFGDEGAKMISEVMKRNSTISELEMSCEEEE